MTLGTLTAVSTPAPAAPTVTFVGPAPPGPATVLGHGRSSSR